MATIKSFTDISQAKVLAKILPLESADMYYMETSCNNYTIGVLQRLERNMLLNQAEYYRMLPCWSLTALLEILPKTINFGYENNSTFVLKPLENGKYLADYYDVSFVKDNPIDACVAMIIKLSEFKML